MGCKVRACVVLLAASCRQEFEQANWSCSRWFLQPHLWRTTCKTPGMGRGKPGGKHILQNNSLSARCVWHRKHAMLCHMHGEERYASESKLRAIEWFLSWKPLSWRSLSIMPGVPGVDVQKSMPDRLGKKGGNPKRSDRGRLEPDPKMFRAKKHFFGTRQNIHWLKCLSCTYHWQL